MSKCYIAFDCGTTGTKTAIYRDGTKVASAYRENPIQYPRPGWAQMDVNVFLTGAREGIRECLASSGIDPREVRGICASGIICGIVGIDADWNPVTPFIPYLDGRATAQAARVRGSGFDGWTAAAGNSTVDEFQPPLVLRWLQESEYAGTFVKVVNNGPYVLGRLAGLKAKDAYIDWATLSGWEIGYDTRTKTWAPDQIEALGIDPKVLPRICSPLEVIGTLCPQEAELLGLPAGIPIAAGAGDVMQSMLGSCAVDPGDCIDIAGTAAILSVAVPQAVEAVSRVPGYYYAMGTLPGTYFYWTMIRAGGLSLRWFRDSIACRTTDPGFFAEIDRAAEAVPAGSDGILFYPYLQGAGPDLPGASGAFVGMHGKAQQPTLWRAVLEAIGFEYDRVIRFYADNGIRVTRIVGAEGGSKSDIWCGIKASLIGARYEALRRSEGGLIANAVCAAYAAGDITDVRAECRRWYDVRRVWEPDAALHALYRQLGDRREKILTGPMAQMFAMLGR